MAHPKWKLINPQRPFRKVEGRLAKAYLYDLDGDLNFQIDPDPDFQYLIEVDGVRNANGLLECEVETLDRYEDRILEAFLPFEGQRVTAHGVWVNDTPHDNKAELHPLDVMFARMLGDQVPEWTDQFLAAYPGSSLFVHKVFSGADQSDNRQPHFNDITRTTDVLIPYPAKPESSGMGGWFPGFELDVKIREHTMYEPAIIWQDDRPFFKFAVTPRSHTEGEPGLILLDIVTYWRTEQKKVV